jgi:hypothetical protein
MTEVQTLRSRLQRLQIGRQAGLELVGAKVRNEIGRVTACLTGGPHCYRPVLHVRTWLNPYPYGHAYILPCVLSEHSDIR